MPVRVHQKFEEATTAWEERSVVLAGSTVSSYLAQALRTS